MIFIFRIITSPIFLRCLLFLVFFSLFVVCNAYLDTRNVFMPIAFFLMMFFISFKEPRVYKKNYEEPSGLHISKIETKPLLQNFVDRLRNPRDNIIFYGFLLSLMLNFIEFVFMIKNRIL